MPRYKLTIEYDGTGFVGWQRQDNGLSVQQCLEEAIFKYRGETAPVTASGRTDAGVHALGQVVHFDLTRGDDTDTVRDAINFHLRPHGISVLQAEEVDQHFHARFSAVERQYIYKIGTRRAPYMIQANRLWHVPVPLDADAMNEAARHLVGTYDFTTFRDSACQAKSPIKTVSEIGLTREQDIISLFIRAPSFLHHMVRNITGSLMYVGSGKWSVEDFISARNAKDRTKGGPTAPPDGLYFLKAVY